MKKLTYLFALMLIASFAFAQAPQGMNYQAVARNAAGNILANQNISVRIAITNGNSGENLYSETHAVQTNQYGLFTLNVGNGKAASGTFANIPWATVTPWLQVEMDAAGGNNFVLMGSSQLLSVPYAIQTDNTSKIQSVPVSPTLPSAGEVLKYNGTTWAPAAATNWLTTGNSGTDTMSNFIGTMDNKGFVIRTNNQKRITVSNTGKLGVGTSIPQNEIDIVSAGAARIGIKANGGTGAFILMDKLLSTNNAALTFRTAGVSNWQAGTFGNDDFSVNNFSLTSKAITVLLSNNYVGIGTTAPGDKLSLRGGALSFHRPVSNDVPYVGIDYDTTADGMRFRANILSSALNQTNMFISRTDGNVGIGTTNPSLAKLQVQGMVGNTVAIFKGTSTSKGVSLIADYPGIFFNSYFNGGVKAMAASGYSSFINTDQSNGALTFSTTNVANTTANAAVTVPERMRITGAGKIGIGTTTPTAKLHVVADAGSPAILAETASGATLVLNGTGAIGADIDFRIGNAWKSSITGNAAGDMYFVNASNAMVFNGLGNLGIGTTTPAAKLDVEGNVKIVDGTQGAGKVLTSDALGNGGWQEPPAKQVSFFARLMFNNFSFNNAPGIKIPFDSVYFNNGNAYDQTNSVFTAPSEGLYQFNLNVQWGTSFTGGAGVLIWKTSAPGILQNAFLEDVTSPQTEGISAIFYLSAGDQVEFRAAEGGSGSQTIYSNPATCVYGYKIF